MDVAISEPPSLPVGVVVVVSAGDVTIIRMAGSTPIWERIARVRRVAPSATIRTRATAPFSEPDHPVLRGVSGAGTRSGVPVVAAVRGVFQEAGQRRSREVIRGRSRVPGRSGNSVHRVVLRGTPSGRMSRLSPFLGGAFAIEVVDGVGVGLVPSSLVASTVLAIAGMGI